MIAKGNLHNNGPYLARYLAAISGGNEQAELEELRGFATENIFDAMALGQLQAEGTRCQKPFFHTQVRTPKGEDLSREQWRKVADRLERKLGFDGQPRAIVFHRKQGHEHMHLIWLRIDSDDMHAIDPGLFKRKLKEACRALEKEMGLQQVRNERDPGERTKPAGRGEYEQSRRLKTGLKKIRESIRDCWEQSDNGRSFAAALEAKGLLLARGDRRAFVIVDEKGGYHALSKRITGATAKDTVARLKDIDAASLPSLERAKAMQHERQPQDGEEARVMPDGQVSDEEERRQEVQRVDEERTEAIREEEATRLEGIKEEEDKRQEAIKTETERQQQAIADEEKRKQEAGREEESRRVQFKEQADRLAQQAEEMQRQERQLEAYKAELARQAEEGKRVAEREHRAHEDARARELEIRNANYRYGQALGQHYNVRDPYASLARSAMAEYGAFLRDRENIERQIARTANPEARQALELRKRIEAAEYMAITSNRIATQSEIIVGRRDTDEAKNQRARAAEFMKEAQELRGQYRELQASRSLEKSERAEGGHRAAPVADKAPPPERKITPPEIRREAHAQKAGGLMVEERQRGKPRGEAVPLSDFVQTVPRAAKPPQRAFTAAEIRRDPAARRVHYAELIAEQNRGQALDRIGEDVKAGRNMSAADVRHLNRDDLDNIKSRGDDHLKQIIHEREKQRQHERER